MRERHERGMQNHAQRTETANNVQEILARVALVESAENFIIKILDGADDEEAAGFLQFGQMRFVLFQMLDFYGHVVRDAGKVAVKFFDQFEGVADAVEKIGIAKRDVLCARGDLLADILQDGVAADDAKNAFVYGHDWTMPAEMFAAAAGFRRTNKPEAAAGNDEVSVFLDGRKAGAVRNFERKAFERDERLRLRTIRWLRATVARLAGLQTIGQLRELSLKFTAENGCHAERSQILRIHRRVQSIAAEVRVRIQFAQRRDQLHSEARGRMHRQINGDQSRAANGGLIERFARKIDALHIVTALAQPRRRRSQAKRLPPQFVRRNQYGVHAASSITGCPPL